MQSILGLFLIFLIGFGVSLIACRAVIAARLMDIPDSDRKRDANKNAVPSSGGLGIMLALGVGLFCVHSIEPLSSDILWLGLGVVAAMCLGLVDDLWNMSAKLKLILQFAIAVGVALAGVYADQIAPGFDKVRDLGAIGGIFIAVCWFVLVTNAVNFMDGANGVSMGMAAFASSGLCAIAGFAGEWDIALAASVLTGALIAFLIWNVGGRLFAGDAGALSVGTALAGLSILLVKVKPDLVFIPIILMSPFLVDVLMTLNYRIKKGDNFWKAHSLHVYQLGLKPPLSLKHWQVAIGHWMIAANCAALAFAAAIIGHEAPLAVFMGVTLLGCWMHVRIRRAAIAVGIIPSAQRGESSD